MSSAEQDQIGSQEESHQCKEKPKKSVKAKVRGKEKIIVNISDCQYPVVTRVSRNFGWKTQKSSQATDWDVCWTDNAVQPETLLRMEHHQKINHFPGMFHLARKNLMGRYLMKMRKKFPSDYQFFPMTWMLPVEYHEFKAYHESKPKGKARTYIVKPEAMSQGKGIFLTRKLDDIDKDCHCVIQRYLHKPYLIQGLKFDLRIYVLVASVDPLRLYIFNQGLARFATQQYVPPTKENMQDVCMHLTNYAINKDNPKFIFNDNSNDMTKGHKRSLTWLYDYLKNNQPKSEGLQERINDLIVKTMISGLPAITNQYRSCQPENYAANMCFELLGFDVILTDKCEPVLLQINHTPSFSTDTPLDNAIKTNYIRDSLNLMNINEKTKNKIVQQRRQACQQRVLTGKKIKLTIEEKQALKKKALEERDKYENKNLGGFKKIYPLEDQQKMNKFEQFLSFAEQNYLISTGTKKGQSLAHKKVQKIQSAFGTCFTRKPKQSLPKSTKTASLLPKKGPNLQNKNYQSKKMIPDVENGGNLEQNSHKQFTHSQNLIRDVENKTISNDQQMVYTSDQNSSNKVTERQQEESSQQNITDDPTSPSYFASQTPNMMNNKKFCSNSTEGLKLPSPPQGIFHANSQKQKYSERQIFQRKSSPQRSPLEQKQKYSLHNKIEQGENPFYYGKNVANSIKNSKNFNFLAEFSNRQKKNKQFQSFRQAPPIYPSHNNQQQMLQIKKPLPQYPSHRPNSLKNADILFEEPQQNQAHNKRNHSSSNVNQNPQNKKLLFDGFRQGANRLGSTGSQSQKKARNNKFVSTSNIQGKHTKYRNISNREKIPIMLNTLLISGSEGNPAISANNLRKILNNK